MGDTRIIRNKYEFSNIGAIVNEPHGFALREGVEGRIKGIYIHDDETIVTLEKAGISTKTLTFLSLPDRLCDYSQDSEFFTLIRETHLPPQLTILAELKELRDKEKSYRANYPWNLGSLFVNLIYVNDARIESIGKDECRVSLTHPEEGNAVLPVPLASFMYFPERISPGMPLKVVNYNLQNPGEPLHELTEPWPETNYWSSVLRGKLRLMGSTTKNTIGKKNEI
jgi:hypothetical protein